MITLVGVGHVFAISDSVKSVIWSRLPSVVCLELDPARYQSLMSRERPAEAPLRYRLLASFQEVIARKFDAEVGEEMVAAASAAQEIGAKLALIDMDARHVLAQLWKRMSLREKLGLFGGALIGMLASRKTVERELDRYERNEEGYLEALARQFPAIKQVLIDERNRYMAEKLKAISSQHGNVLAVVGDGHIPGLLAYLGSTEVEAVRLRELRSQEAKGQASAGFSYSFWYRAQ